MASVRVYNATLMTMAPGFEPVAPGELVASDGTIDYVGPQRGNHSATWDTEIDAAGGVLIPGLVNAHTHLAMTLLRGYADDMPLHEWLTTKIWPTEARLTEDDVYWGAMLGILEMLRGGTTCFSDMYHFFNAGTRAAIDGGMRALPSGVLLQLAEETSSVQAAVEFALQVRQDAPSRIVPMLGPHAPYSCTDGMLEQVAQAAQEHDLGIHIHLSETFDEVEQVIAASGLRPVHYLEELGVLENTVAAAHCIYVDDDELEVLIEKQVGIVHCPISAMKLGSGYARIPEMLAGGARLGLGTDGCASNNRLDMLQEARMAALMHKGYTGDPALIKAEEALHMATVGSAETLGLGEQIGTLEVGKRADFTIISLDAAHNQPLHNVFSQLIYAVEAADVVCTAVDGVVLYHNGEYPHLDAEHIIARANECAMRLVNSQ
jgi:5-methylthioadenosine/S-adenosylhomocysteine deaminase